MRSLRGRPWRSPTGTRIGSSPPLAFTLTKRTNGNPNGPHLSRWQKTAGAIGEIGLDFYRNLSPRDEQLKAFADQLHLAEDLDKPAIVHCRDAFSETHEIIESTGVGQRVVMHCWTGGSRWTRRFLELGVMISFAGPLAFETGETIRGAAAVVPPERAMVETDTPYLSPPPYRGEPNEPSRVALVGAALAGVWETTEEEVARVTSENARRMFRP